MMSHTIIIPTYNEAQQIPKLLPYLWKHGAKRIIVANSPATVDQTASLATALGAELLPCPQAGRAAQMNYAAHYANTELLYFVHADTFPPSTFMQDIAKALDQGIDLGYFRYQFDDDRPLLRLNSYCTRFDGWFAGGGDQTLFIKQSAFRALGGFRQELCLMEDFDLVWRAREAGFTHRLIPNNALVSARKYRLNSWLRVNLVNLSVFAMFHCGVPTNRLSRLYRRWLRSG